MSVQSESDSPASAGQGRWSVGTLTYTAGGLALLFALLLLGDFAWQLRERSAAPVVQLLIKKFQASDLLTGFVLITVPWTVIMIVGPAVSFWSDRHRGRWGRRIPFILVQTPMVALAMVGIAFSPVLGPMLHRAWGGRPETLHHTVLLMIGLCWTVFEIGAVTANAVFNALINDVVPRDMLGRFYGLFRAVGLGAGIFFNYKIIGHAEENYTIILVSIGLAYGVGLTLMCLRVKEGEYPPPPPSPSRSTHLLVSVIGDYFRDCFAKPYYLLAFIFLGSASLAFVPVNTFSIYAARSYGMTMDTYGKYLVVTYICSFCLAYPLGWLADRLHPLRLGIGAMVLYSLAMGVGFARVHDAGSFGIFFLAHGILAGTYFTGTAAIAQMLFPKLKFAQFAAAAGFIAALFNISLGPALGTALDRLHNNYRYTLLAGGIIALTSVVLGFFVHRRWTQLGGQAGYVPPE
jgi:MFS family permease